MSLNKERIKTAIKAAFKYEQTEEQDPDASLERIADKLAEAVLAEIQNAQINYASGLAAPNGAVTGAFVGNLS